MTQHTPGPWQVVGSPIAGTYISNEDDSIEVCEFHFSAFNPADAALIAAAPDLLEALRKIASIEANRHMIATWQELASEAIDIARAAIRKAEPQS